MSDSLDVPGLEDLTESEAVLTNGGIDYYEMLFNAGVWTLGSLGGPLGGAGAGAITTSGVYTKLVDGLATWLTPLYY